MKNTYLMCIALVVSISGCSENKPMPYSTLYVGTYTDGDSEGIYQYAFDTETGSLTAKKLVAMLDNPSFLKISPDRKYLYAVQETDNYDSLGGGISAFEIAKDSLRFLNNESTAGKHPCHIGISEDGEQLAVSNYTGGNLSIFQLEEDGSLPRSRQIIDHKNLDSTKVSHVHSAQFTPEGLFVADLGLDAIKRYVKTDLGYAAAPQKSIDFPTKSGPRHFVFGQEGKFMYVINELNSTITVFKKNNNGVYNEISAHSTVAAEFNGKSFCADIHLSKDGKFLYGSNRGENSIVVFSVNQETGDLALVGHTPVEGDWPRNFTLDPTENFLLVANQKSNNITVFKRDTGEGTLNFLNEVKMDSPVCLAFMN